MSATTGVSASATTGVSASATSGARVSATAGVRVSATGIREISVSDISDTSEMSCTRNVKGVADNVYEVESILFDDIFDRKTMYLVKWKNYPMDQLTWEPDRNLNNCQEILNEYKANKIVARDVYKTHQYTKLFDELNSYSEPELLELFHQVVDEKISPIEERFVKGSIAYLSTLSNSNRNKMLMKFCRRNLMLIEIYKRRQRQLERLAKWQNDMKANCSFNLSVVNKVDFEGPPKKFIYVDHCVAGNGVSIPNDPPLWCHCEETCTGGKRRKLDCHFHEAELAYNKFKRVIVAQGTPIYECNKKCTCDSTCVNRVVQHGPNKNLKLQIFRTDNNRGWGVKTLAAIKKGSYVTKYAGEVITRAEADQRAVTHGSKSTYLFDLDYNTDKNDSLFSIDATTFGNVSHFINHSCDSNLAIYAVWIDCLDTNIPTLALFASRDIGINEEITFNYKTSVNNTKRRIKCKCLSKNCRGYLC